MKNPLKPRELKVIKMICQEKTNVEMSKILNLNTRSIERIRGRMYKKTRTHSSMSVLKWAITNGMYSVKIKTLATGLSGLEKIKVRSGTI